METEYQNEDPSTPPPCKRKESNCVRSPPRRFSLDALNTPISITKNTTHHHHNHQHHHHQPSSQIHKRHGTRNSMSSTNSSSSLSIYLLSPGFTPHKTIKSPKWKRNSQDMKVGSLLSSTNITTPSTMASTSSPTHSLITKSPIQGSIRKSTIGSGRSSSIPIFPSFEFIEPEDNINIPGEIDISETPQTPIRNIKTNREVNQWLENAKGVEAGRMFAHQYEQEPEEEDEDQDDSEEEEKDAIRQYLGLTKRRDLENPFIESISSSSPIRKLSTPPSSSSQISNPFIHDPIDYSTHIELIKSNGQKVVKELPTSLKSIKPKRLNFSSFNTLSPPPSSISSSSLFTSPFNTIKRNQISQDISSKYINKNLNGLFIKPKNIPDFEIFNDDNNNFNDNDNDNHHDNE
ncbi:hypothetical protein DFJ63DRAFT_170493 [Scheffersomyces coipomensis]|uniref:uncharacterized protein n=1 Tax=Scheffersomyces coipomensis TaxID=1788519 RepID=UPI00315C74C0